MKKLVRLTGYFLVMLSLLFVISNLVENLDSVPSFPVDARAILGLIGVTAICTIVVAIISFAWLLLIKGGGVSLAAKQAFVLVGRSQIGKYLPGNIFHYAGRIALGRQQGIPIEVIVLSTSVETFLIVATGSALAAAGLLFDNLSSPVPIRHQSTKAIFIILFASIVIAAILFIITKFSLGARNWINSRLSYLHIGRITASVLLYTTVFVLFGLSISLLLNLLWGVDADLRWYQFTWGFAAAWVTGFVTPGAPGGVGIRETILFSLYSHELGEGLAMSLSLTLRAVTIMGDLAAFALAHYLGKISRLGCD